VRLLAVETSCDETAAAVLRDTQLLSNIVATQEIHQLYGGVVPELASRAYPTPRAGGEQGFVASANFAGGAGRRGGDLRSRAPSAHCWWA
jgi:hypothetical protein